MPALPELPPRPARDLCLVVVNRGHFNARAIEQQLELAPADLALSGLDDDCGFQEAGSRQKAHARQLDCGSHATCVCFIQKQGNENRGINDHLAGQAMPVVAENFVGRSGVLIRERGTAPCDLHDFVRERSPRLPAPDTLQALFGSAADGGSHRLAGDRCEFAHAFLCGRVLYVQRQYSTFIEIICQ